MHVAIVIILIWAGLIGFVLVGWDIYIQAQRARTQNQLDYFAAVDHISTRAHSDAMDAYSRIVMEAQAENRAMLQEVVALVHGPPADPDVDRDDVDPALEMTGPWGDIEANLSFRDPTDDALPDEEIMGYGPGGARMESDVVIDR